MGKFKQTSITNYFDKKDTVKKKREEDQNEENPKKMKADCSEEDSKLKMTVLNPMVFQQKFPHIVEKVFDHLDQKNLKNCRIIDKSWQNFIDTKNILWQKIVIDIGPNKAFQMACKIGHIKMTEMLIQKHSKFHVDYNAHC